MSKLANLDGWNPITSPKTKFVEFRADGARIYSHNALHVHGKFITVWDKNNWVASDAIEQAREAVL